MEREKKREREKKPENRDDEKQCTRRSSLGYSTFYLSLRLPATTISPLLSYIRVRLRVRASSRAKISNAHSLLDVGDARSLSGTPSSVPLERREEERGGGGGGESKRTSRDRTLERGLRTSWRAVLYKSWTTLLLFQCKDDVHSEWRGRDRGLRRSSRAHRSFERRSIHLAPCPLSLDTGNEGVLRCFEEERRGLARGDREN